MSLLWRIRIGAVLSAVLINGGGALAVFLLTILVIPLPVVYDEQQVLRNLQLLALTTPAILLFAVVMGARIYHRTMSWVIEGRRPYPDEQLYLLSVPDRVFLAHAGGWAVATIVIGSFNAAYDLWLGLVTATAVALSGLTAAATAYLVSERITRPLARQALRRGVPDRVRVRTVAARTMFAWLLGTGVPLLGLLMVGVNTLADSVLVSVRQLSITMLALGALTLLVGGVTTYIAARATADPVHGLSEAFAGVSRGDLGTRVQIDDGTEIGLLQASFNTMVAGLRERDRMRDLFGRHVGGDVAQAALEGDNNLGGETRHVTVLFVDIVGVAAIANEREPEDVVRLLNRFLEVVVAVVHDHGGWINKFEDDGVLAIWGAPNEVPDMEQKALRAARVMAERLRDEVTELDAGIGVSAGRAVAGNVGALTRYEYTVIGDPVNEAARLTDLAKDTRGRVAVNAALLASAGDEAEHWSERKPVQLRGRGDATRLAVPKT